MTERNDSGQGMADRKNEPNLTHVLNEPVENAPVDNSGVVRRHHQESWLQKNANLLILAGGFGVSLLLLLVLGFQLGWFGGGASKPASPSVSPSPPPSVAQPSTKPETPPAATVPQQPASPAVATSPEPPSKPAPAAADKPSLSPPSNPSPTIVRPGGPAKPSPADVAAKKDEKEKPKQPPLPRNVAKWKKGDYYRARREGNPKLLEAVAYLGKKFAGSNPSARGLADLLKPLKPEKPSAAGAPSASMAIGVGGHTASAKLVEAIVEALGCNGSETARETLEQILAGKLPTDDDKTAVEAALKTLVAHPSNENDAILVRVVLSAESVRAADHAGPWPAKDLQAKALELIKPAASFRFRTKLAEEIVGEHGKFDPKDPTIEFLLASDPRNCGAQFLFYRSGDVSGDTKTAIEKQFLDDGSKAMAWSLGVSDAPQAAASDPSGGGNIAIRPAIVPARGVPAEPEKAEELEKAKTKSAQANPLPDVANLLWSQDFRDLLEPQLKPSAMERDPHLLLLAGTVPNDTIRAAVAKVLRKRWYDGPKALQGAGLLDRVVTDPGLLITIKTGPRRDSPSTARPAAASPSRSGRAAKPGGSKASESAGKRQQTEQEWMDVSAKLVDAWRKRFAPATGKGKAKADAEAATDVKPPEGFQFGAGATVKYARHIAWPDDAPSELDRDNLGSLEVYYFRAEESATVKKLVGFYARQAQLRNTTETRLLDKSVWIDSLRTATRKDRRRSLDVLITRTSGGTGEAYENNDEADFLVEVLIVETAAPPKD